MAEFWSRLVALIESMMFINGTFHVVRVINECQSADFGVGALSGLEPQAHRGLAMDFCVTHSDDPYAGPNSTFQIFGPQFNQCNIFLTFCRLSKTLVAPGGT